jgi:ubiquinone/menaquinone biosynthesis C-methylase UbiE
MNKKTAKEILEKVKKDYSKISNEFDKTRQNEWSEFKEILPFIKDNSKVTDLGCGNGRLYNFIVKNNKTIKYTGIDNNKDLLKKAKRNKNTNFILGDMLEIPLKDNSQDSVITIAAIHHIPSKGLREQAIKEIERVLKKNGTLILTAWNLFQPKYKKYTWYSLIKHIVSFGKYDYKDTLIPWGNSGVKRYYYAFTKKELEKLLEKKFEIIKKVINKNFTYICRKK